MHCICEACNYSHCIDLALYFVYITHAHSSFETKYNLPSTNNNANNAATYTDRLEGKNTAILERGNQRGIKYTENIGK